MTRSKNKNQRKAFQYDICLSFAGEDREYVEEVARIARQYGIKTFYDKYEQSTLWGKDLYCHLDKIYRSCARFCIIFVSKSYKKKLWSNHERRSAQARAFSENDEYILPARFDDTEIPGLVNTVGYIDLRITPPTELVSLIQQKLAHFPKEEVLPEKIDELLASLGVEDEMEVEEVTIITHDFFNTLKKMSESERLVVFTILLQGCPSELPENIHMSLDLIRRNTGISIVKIMRLLGEIRSLGFYSYIKDGGCEEESLGTLPVAYLEWHNLSTGTGGGNKTEIAAEIISVAASCFCECHGMEALLRLDFTGLSSEKAGANCNIQPAPGPA